MLYAIVFLVIFVIVIAIWIIRLSVNQSRRAKFHNADPEVRAAEVGPRPTLVGTARDVGDRMFGSAPSAHEDYVHYPRSGYNDPPRAQSYAERGRGSAVNRTETEGGDPELPSYNDRTTVSVPQAAYSSPITARHETQRGGQNTSNPPSFVDAPPKYDEAPPIVRTL
ncbi:hypothetical protein DB88DRAFT_491477 [Papiliotrema laurentii]|uniref:Uncharacterized protein n=1 Tax=Papiliotrema laurentii TaxID=5418 RepID=A0AAD9CZM7_PAPLA|nr:hypothetical protein DB88DRAFT_491477 [Papiliotrema laurentii]